MNFDSRPPSHQHPQSALEVKHKLPFEIHSHNLSNSMRSSLLKYNYSGYELDNFGKESLLLQRQLLLDNISAQESIYPVKITKTQRREEWYQQRRLRITASNCKAVFTDKSDESVKTLFV